jgi:hypothetical protein
MIITLSFLLYPRDIWSFGNKQKYIYQSDIWVFFPVITMYIYSKLVLISYGCNDLQKQIYFFGNSLCCMLLYIVPNELIYCSKWTQILLKMNTDIVPNEHRYCSKWKQILFQMNTDTVPSEHRYCSKWTQIVLQMNTDIVSNEHKYSSKWTQILF